MESLQEENPLNVVMESKSPLIIKNKKRSWIEHILYDIPYTKWIYTILYLMFTGTLRQVLSIYYCLTVDKELNMKRESVYKR